MQRYLQQLIEDLRKAQEGAPVVKDPEEKTEEDVMRELQMIDAIIEKDVQPRQHNIFGIDPDVFPPIEKLSTDQATELVKEILALWDAFHIEAVYPKNFPPEKLYPLLVEKFRTPFMYFPGGITGVEFCSYEPEECPFGEEYCTCKEIIARWEEENKQISKADDPGNDDSKKNV